MLACVIALCLGAVFMDGALAAASSGSGIDNDIPDLLLAAPRQSEIAINAALASAPSSREIIRQRPLELDFSSFEKMRAAIAANQPQTIRIRAFDDVALLVQFIRTERFGKNGYAYFGTVSGAAFSSVVIVEENGVVSGNINVLDKKYQIRHAGAAGHILQQIDPAAFPPDHPATPVAKAVKSIRVSATNVTPTVRGTQTAQDDGSLIDVMVVYTPSARISEGGTAGMQSRINLVVAETNNAYLNSGVVQRIRLVYAGEVNYTETDLLTDLGRLQTTNDGFMDEVHALRNLYGADLVSLWGNYPSAGGCGQSYVMLTEAASFESQAFTVVDRNCAASNYSFAHELGHNMGLLHDTADAPGGTFVTQAGSPSPSTPIAIGYAPTQVACKACGRSNQFRGALYRCNSGCTQIRTLRLICCEWSTP